MLRIAPRAREVELDPQGTLIAKTNTLETRMSDTFRIRPGAPDTAVVEGLADVLLDVVEGGGASVGFMSPLTRAKAIGFWKDQRF